MGQGDLAVLDELYAPDAASQDLRTFKQVVQLLRKAIPNLRVSPHQIVAAGDSVAVHWRLDGTHDGPLSGVSVADAAGNRPIGEDNVRLAWEVQPTGRPVRIEGATFFRIRGGRIVSAWVLVDQLSALHQFGGLPIPNRMSS
jgi:predicted ester cyclase